MVRTPEKKRYDEGQKTKKGKDKNRKERKER